MKTFLHFTIALAEALMKCLPVLIIQGLVIYPLIVLGQGQEALNSIFDAQIIKSSWLSFPLSFGLFAFPISYSYSCVLMATFLYFLLSRWSYRANDGARAFCRIWIPSTLTLLFGLLWPLIIEWNSKDSSRIWDVMTALCNFMIIAAMVGGGWYLTKPTISNVMIIFLAIASFVLIGSFVFGPILLFYGCCFITLTLFCVLARNDFICNKKPQFPAWFPHLMGMSFAVIFSTAILLISGASAPWQMMIGTPTIVIWSFSFLIALAFILTAILKIISPVFARLGWVLMIVILLLTPLNHETLRIIPSLNNQTRLTPSAHFIEWLRARPEVKNAVQPYPIFFVAAEGGGVRAAYWSSTVLAGLEELYPGFTKHIYGISGVSGGSLGATLFTSMYLDLPKRGDKGCAPLVTGGIHGLRPCIAYMFNWDLLGPALSGLFLHDIPFGFFSGVRRAEDLERGLEFAWLITMESRRFEEPFQDLWTESHYELPSLILNTTSVENGNGLVVSNMVAKNEITSEPDIETIIGHPIRLSTATFLSARFPIISPVAIYKLQNEEYFRLADGGYFNNSGVATVTQLLRTIIPILSTDEFKGKFKPVVLVLSSAPAKNLIKPEQPSGSLASAMTEPLSILKKSGDAHETTYLSETIKLIGDENLVIRDIRPPNGSAEVALGWMLSARTRCDMDKMVNDALNGVTSKGASAIGNILGQTMTRPANWISCRTEAVNP